MNRRSFFRRARWSWGIAASIAVHACALTALAVTTFPELQRRLWETRTPFAGQQITVTVSFARPELPPLPEIAPSESPVEVTPHAARLERHVYVERLAAVAPPVDLPAPAVEIAELTVPPPQPADRNDPAAHDAPAQAKAATAPKPTRLAKAQRRVEPSTASVTVKPQVAGVSDRPAQLHHNRPPRYPDLARRNRWEGTVMLKLFIDAQGRVSDVEVVRSSGYPILDAEAAAAVRIWRGEPAMRDGRPVASEEVLPVRFRL